MKNAGIKFQKSKIIRSTNYWLNLVLPAALILGLSMQALYSSLQLMQANEEIVSSYATDTFNVLNIEDNYHDFEGALLTYLTMPKKENLEKTDERFIKFSGMFDRFRAQKGTSLLARKLEDLNPSMEQAHNMMMRLNARQSLPEAKEVSHYEAILEPLHEGLENLAVEMQTAPSKDINVASEKYQRWFFWSVIALGLSGFILILLNLYRLNRVQKLSRENAEAFELLQKRQAAIEAAGDGIGIVDAAGNFIYVNKALLELHGIDRANRDHYLGQPWINLYTEKGKQIIKDHVLPELTMHGYWRGDSPIVRRDGTIVHAEMSLTELPDGGFIGTARDVSERIRSAEEKKILEDQFLQAQKMEAVGRLAGGIAHDFNNILAAMTGYAEFLVEDLDEGSPQYDFAVKLLSAGRQARDLVDQMLAFSRRKESTRAELDLIVPIEETVSMLHASLPKSIDFTTEFLVREAPVNANATQIAQILMNLCVNAKDALEHDNGQLKIILSAMEKGAKGIDPEMVMPGLPDPKATPLTRIIDAEPGRTRLTLGTISSDHDYFCLSVVDSGSGMSRVIMEHVFEPFFTTKPIDKGTGLGLATVHGAVVAHQGALVIDSTLGQGTRFDIYLPASQNIAKLFEDEEGGDVSINGARILLVEDQKEVLDMMVKMLERLGCMVECSTSGLDALDKLREKPGHYSLVLTDHNMPKMTGLELVQQAAIDFPDLPFILLSGYSENKLKELMNEHESVKEILHKPVSKSVLKQKLGTVLSRSHKQAA